MREARFLGGSGSMLPQENFGIFDFLRAHLVHSDLMSEVRAAIMNIAGKVEFRSTRV